MKANAALLVDALDLQKPAGPPFYFVCNHRRDGCEHFNFPPQLRSRHPMQCTHALTRGLLVLAASILLLSHPQWEVSWGRRRAAEVARELAPPFAREHLIPYAGRDWIISSTTVREWAVDALGELPESEVRPALNEVRSTSFTVRRYSRGRSEEFDPRNPQVPPTSVGKNRRPLPHLDRIILLAAQPAGWQGPSKRIRHPKRFLRN